MKQIDFYRLDDMQCSYGNNYIIMVHYAHALYYYTVVYCFIII